MVLKDVPVHNLRVDKNQAGEGQGTIKLCINHYYRLMKI